MSNEMCYSLLRRTCIDDGNDYSFQYGMLEWKSVMDSIDIDSLSPVRLKQRVLLLSVEIHALMDLRQRNPDLFEVA